MAIRKISRRNWQTYFDTFSKSLLESSRSQYAEVRIFSPDFGAQKETSWLPLGGITYDRHNDLLDIAVEHMDHMIRGPVEIFVDEDQTGVVFSLEVTRRDGTKEVIEMR